MAALKWRFPFCYTLWDWWLFILQTFFWVHCHCLYGMFVSRWLPNAIATMWITLYFSSKPICKQSVLLCAIGDTEKYFSSAVEWPQISMGFPSHLLGILWAGTDWRLSYVSPNYQSMTYLFSLFLSSGLFIAYAVTALYEWDSQSPLTFLWKTQHPSDPWFFMAGNDFSFLLGLVSDCIWWLFIIFC